MAYPLHESAGTPKATTIQSSVEDFDPVITRLEQLGERLAGCSDRINGSRPSEVLGNKDHPPPQSLIAQLQERRARLVRIVDHIETEMQRLETGLA